ncbi:MAG: hypothetical protein IID33_11405, partial [Planctomycetes bacterium]|nr:hypothetical protein [Planctomycetota bacterium]
MSRFIAIAVLIASSPLAYSVADDDYIQIGKDKRWNEPPPELPDLSVQFISRTPRYLGLKPEYTEIENDIDGEGPTAPITLARPDAKRNPAPGDEVTFTAVVRNVGRAAAPGFDWTWLYDGRDVLGGVRSEPLGVNETAVFTLKQRWDAGKHFIAFQ